MKKTQATQRERSLKIERIRSIPEDAVIAPQTEPPRHMKGRDQSRPKAQVRELSWNEFDRWVQELARDVGRSFKPDAVMGIAHGGVFVGGALARALSCEFFPVRLSPRSRDARVKKPKSFGHVPNELKNRCVLVVDDVVASGDTLALARKLLMKVKAKDVRTACLLEREDGYRADFAAQRTDEFVVFPWDYEPLTEDGRFI